MENKKIQHEDEKRQEDLTEPIVVIKFMAFTFEQVLK